MKLDEIARVQRSPTLALRLRIDSTTRRRARWDRIAGIVLGCVTALGVTAPGRAQAGDLDLAIALEAGAAWTDSDHVYREYDYCGGSSVRSGGVSHWGPAGALQLALTGRLHGALRLGGVVRPGIAEGTRPISGAGELQHSIAIGPTLRLESDDPEHGPYGGVWVGLSVVSSESLGFGGGLGFAGGLDGGYRWSLPEDWSLGIGVSVSTQWRYDSDQADHGIYEYLQRSVWPTLQLRVVHGLSP